MLTIIFSEVTTGKLFFIKVSINKLQHLKVYTCFSES